MIGPSLDAWSLFHSGLWVAGLALMLAVSSIASYAASVEGVRFREAIVRSRFQLALFLSLGLFSLGLLLGGSAWWLRVVWGVLTVLFFGQAVRIWWHAKSRSGAAWGWLGRGVAVAPGTPAAESASAESRRTAWLGRGLVLVGLLVMGAAVTVAGLRVVKRGRSLEQHLRGLEGLVQDGTEELDAESLEAVVQHVSAMRYDLEAIQGSAGPLLPLGRVLRYVPRHGGDLAAASDLLQVAVGVASAGDRVFLSLSPLLEPGSAPAPSLGERLLSVVAATQLELRTAHEELGAVEQARARIDAGTLSPRVAGLLERLDRYLPWLEAAVDGLLLAPQLLAATPSPESGIADGPRTYLILAQNNHELRPTGGFISGVGELTVEGGRVSSLSFSDSYAVDNLEVPHDLAPPDLKATLAGELWLFRDANWQADFPTSARRALEIYARDREIHADGLVALDMTLLVSLLDLLGPLEVEGIEEPVTSQNVMEVIQAGWRSPPESWDLQSTEWFLHRKDTFGSIAAAALDRLVAADDLDLMRLVLVLRKVLEEKHLLVYFDDPDAAGLVGRMDWDGALPDLSVPCDSLLVADTNVGFNKVDPNVERTIDYQVDLSDSRRPEARLILTYRNHSQRPIPYCIQQGHYGETYADMMDRCYWDYVRVYVPTGSKLLKAPDTTLPSGSLLVKQGAARENREIEGKLSEGDWTAWTAFFDLAPGEERTLAFEYRLPRSVLERAGAQYGYCLHVQKQPGTEAVPFCLEVLPPAGAELVEWAPGDQPLSERVCTDLRTDREFAVHYEIGKGP